MKYAKNYRFKGVVQGVGFRPWIYLLALEENLKGWVFNDGEGVLAHLEGSTEALERFTQRTKKDIPPLAQIESCEVSEAPFESCPDFKIVESQNSKVLTSIPADSATCEVCLTELFDPSNRRYRYPFINCTHCGPRYTITKHLPYDRPQTSMRLFAMCEPCEKEYRDPLDRRFHAQPICCDQCGPELWLADAKGQKIDCSDPIAELTQRILSGQIVAVKGLGGFHLVCDAQNAEVVKKLRTLKNRPSKPFAIMTCNVESARSYLEISDPVEQTLLSKEAPIVLCPKTEEADKVLEGIAPGLDRIGLMLPYTPIHWLIFYEASNRPKDFPNLKKKYPLCLVMTSANQGGEPLVIDNDEALRSLGNIADTFLFHNREILIRCDDSVLIADKSPRLIRRARGFTPNSVALPFSGESVLATGSWLKNTACLTKNSHAYLSQHIGDLDRSSNCLSLKASIQHLEKIFQATPTAVACDLHPDFYSTRLAEEISTQYDIPLYTVQHHHAHIASVMAENHLVEPVLGLALDGVGLGDDGTSWGGEILKVDPLGYQRLAHLAPMPMPGGDRCAREGWRLALSLLLRSNVNQNDLMRFDPKKVDQIAFLLKNPNLPLTTILGRLFDTASSLLGIADISTYEGESAMKLEAVARQQSGTYLRDLVICDGDSLDFSPLLLSLMKRKDTVQAASDFHTTVAEAFADKVIALAEKYNIRKVCASGGCCLNTLLMKQLRHRFEVNRIEFLEAKNIPANDGGLSLGQAYVVLMKKHCEGGHPCV